MIVDFYEVIPILMMISLAVLLFSGLPVALILAGLGVLFSLLGILIGEMPVNTLFILPVRMAGAISTGFIFPAVAMLLFMSVALQLSGIARDMLLCFKALFGRLPGGLAVAVIFLGILLAPAAGLVGASVATLTVVALPTMLSQGYDTRLATGSIAASGTLGIILPPAVMLFFLGFQFSVSIGAMYVATLLPVAMLAGLYICLFVALAIIRPPAPTRAPVEENFTGLQWMLFFTRGLILPAGLIFLVLGSIIFSWATPSQSAAVGASGALFLMILNGRLNWTNFKELIAKTVQLNAMVFFIVMAAALFSFPFRYFGGDMLIRDFLLTLPFGPWTMLLIILGILFVLGFFIDWIEIMVISLPVLVPVMSALDFAGYAGDAQMTKIWLATLVALTLQTSLLTPPFGFALFFLKGSAPPEVKLSQVYRGVAPVIVMQVIGISLAMAIPKIITYLPQLVFETRG